MFNAETYPFSRKLPGKRKFSRNFLIFASFSLFAKMEKTVFVSTLIYTTLLGIYCAVVYMFPIERLIFCLSNKYVVFLVFTSIRFTIIAQGTLLFVEFHKILVSCSQHNSSVKTKKTIHASLQSPSHPGANVRGGP
jgi:hypothetical protein